MINILTNRSLRVATLFSVLFLSVGCLTTKKDNLQVAEAQGSAQMEVAEQLKRELKKQQQKVNELEQQLKAQKKLTGSLQLALLGRHAEIDKLVLANQRLVRDFTRDISKSRSRGDKTETIRLIAEVDTVLISIAEDALSGDQEASLLRAQKYLQEGKKELDKGNHEAASYLASQALTLAQDIQLNSGDQEGKGEGVDVDFLVPLPMVLLEGSNVRNGSSMKDKVLFVLKKGSRVSATGYRGQWVKVEVPERGEGWIYYSLLGGV